MPAENSAQKQRGRPFKPGASGNPSGKPKGSRHRLTMIAEALMENQAAEVVQAVIDRAKGGDMAAARLVLERIAPPRKGRPVTFDLPAVDSVADVLAALGSIVRAVSDGTLTPDEAAGVAGLLELKRKAMETADIERRLAALEGRHEQEA